LTCFCVVKFDIEIGQTLEYTYPPTSFTEEETTNICFLSFPDSNSNAPGTPTSDVVYSFRTKRIKGNGSTSDSFLNGYVFFRQEKNSNLARGYLQKSVVLLSRHAYVGLFRKVVSVVGPLLFEFGRTLLEASYQNIARWPPPKPGHTFELPILGSILTFHVPFSSSPHIIDPSARSVAMVPRDQVVSNLQSVNIYSVFKSVIQKLWLLWELVLVGEPLLVMSPSPAQCSDAVLGLVSLISPLPYSGDYRPYFTIHDSDFKEYTNSSTSRSLILGVTNPFFFKALDHWPHVIVIGNSKHQQSRSSGTLENLQAKASKDPVTKLVMDFRQSVNTNYRGSVEVDKKVMKQLIGDTQSPLSNAVNNELLRRHFLRLTETFLIPLERYFTSLMPLARSISIFHRPPRLKPFDESEFLDILGTLDKRYVIDNKAKEVALYRQFLQSCNFQGWFAERQQAALHQLNKLYRKAILEADISANVKTRSQVDLVDLYMRLRDLLVQEEALPPTEDSQKMIGAVQKHLQKLTSLIPSLPVSPATAKQDEIKNNSVPNNNVNV